VEEKIPAKAKVLGIAIKDMQLPDHCVIAAIIRKGEILVPTGKSTFEVGDEVLAVTDRNGAEQLARMIAPQAQGNSQP
jgi:trk system potassium uptake protein TrkA